VHAVGDAESSLGDSKSPLGDAKSSLSDAESSLGDAKSSLGDAKSSLGDAKSSLGDAKSSLSDAKSSLGDAKSPLGEFNVQAAEHAEGAAAAEGPPQFVLMEDDGLEIALSQSALVETERDRLIRTGACVNVDDETARLIRPLRATVKAKVRRALSSPIAPKFHTARIAHRHADAVRPAERLRAAHASLGGGGAQRGPRHPRLAPADQAPDGGRNPQAIRACASSFPLTLTRPDP
jgi:hypothetical protein